MSNRTRTRASRPYPARPRLNLAWLPAVLAVAAEAGHLAAAYLEWPSSATRGGYHVLAGALLGLVAAAVAIVRIGPDRVRLGAGATVALAGPVLWLGGAVLDRSPYAELPTAAAAGVAVAELALAALLLAALLSAAGRPTPGSAAARRSPGRRAAAGWVDATGSFLARRFSLSSHRSGRRCGGIGRMAWTAPEVARDARPRVEVTA
jgi:hypothetical protein